MTTKSGERLPEHGTVGQRYHRDYRQLLGTIRRRFGFLFTTHNNRHNLMV